MRYLFAYNPTESFRQEISPYADVVTEWSDEILYEPNEPVVLNDEVRDLLYESAEGGDGMIIGQAQLEDTKRRKKFSDLFPDSRLGNIVEREDPGGDIRKYLNDRYGNRWSLDFRVWGTAEPTITSFGAFSEESVREISTFEFTYSDVPDDTTRTRYPTTGQIIEWGERVSEKWGVDWGSIGSLHFYDDHKGGFNGFIVYDAHQDLFEWAKKKWKTHPNSGEPYTPFMTPSEFDMRPLELGGREEQKVIRMWWD